MAAHILHIDQRAVPFAQNSAVDRAGLKIEGRRAIDFSRQRIKPRGPHAGFGQGNALQPVHHIAEHRAHRATACPRFLAHLCFEIGFDSGAHHNRLKVRVIIDTGHHILKA